MEPRGLCGSQGNPSVLYDKGIYFLAAVVGWFAKRLLGGFNLFCYFSWWKGKNTAIPECCFWF